MKNVLCFIVILIIGCDQVKVEPVFPLHGTWAALSMIVGDSVSNINVTTSTLQIKEDSRYNFTNNLGQIEAGTYIVSDSLLILTDTISKPSKEKAVQVVRVNSDTLTIRMNFNGKESFMYFKRK